MVLKFEHGAYRLTGGVGQNKKLYALGFRYGQKRWTARTHKAAFELLRAIPEVRIDTPTRDSLKSWVSGLTPAERRTLLAGEKYARS